MSLLSQFLNPENKSQYNLVIDFNSNRSNDLLSNKTIPINLYINLLTFRDIDKKFELQGDLLKKMTNIKFNVDPAEISDKNNV